MATEITLNDNSSQDPTLKDLDSGDWFTMNVPSTSGGESDMVLFIKSDEAVYEGAKSKCLRMTGGSSIGTIVRINITEIVRPYSKVDLTLTR